MISPQEFCAVLARHGLQFFCGVPDSLLKDLCAYFDEQFSADQHIITANEGNAIALAAGHYLGSGTPGVVYMQNSGLGNAVNPLTSLADPAVYSIPMLLVVGWRGEPGGKDEPQHAKQGLITEAQLKVLDLPYRIVDAGSDLGSLLPPLLRTMTEQSRPVALLVRAGTFARSTAGKKPRVEGGSFLREQALAVVLDLFSPDDLIISTTGKTSRELFELRQKRREPNRDFLTVGSMGHTSSIALGVALAKPERRVIAIDGDGSLLMHLGALPIIGSCKPANLLHVLLNNHCHESVGGQPTVAGQIAIGQIALASGYKQYRQTENEQALRDIWPKISQAPGPTLLEIKIAEGSRGNLGRPNSTPQENKQLFMRHAGSLR
jgi:phosphonopyruvate decarboxylase